MIYCSCKTEVYIMPKIKYHVCLTEEERKELLNIVTRGTASARTIMHANVLLTTDETHKSSKKSEEKIAEQYHVNSQTVHTIRRTYAEKGLFVAIGRKKRMTPPVEEKITGEVEAKIIALSCSKPPVGRSRWSLRLLADKAVEIQIIDSISHEAVSRLLKKQTQAPSP
jgi:transposase